MLSEGQILEGKYRVERLLQKGGMGAVFVGQHTTIKRKVAIKVLHDMTRASADTVRRFEKEAQAAGQIGSDHIVEVLDLGNTAEGDRFMVMEFLDGQTLTDRIKQNTRLSPSEAVPLVVQLLEGLGAAHAAGIVHRDLKPDNIFILKEKAGRRDFVKIVDFGVSKFASLEGEGGKETKDGAVMGTPFYMSPEQARSANEADGRSDLYSVGVILFEAVTGAVPFRATTFADLLFKIVFEEPPHPTSLVPHLDPEFADIVMKAMARDPAARFQTARELQSALHQWIVRHAAGGSVSRPGAAPSGAPGSGGSGNHSSYGHGGSSQPSLGSGSHPLGSHPSGSHPLGSHPSGSHPSGSHSSGSHSPGSQAPSTGSGSIPGAGTAYIPQQPSSSAPLPFAHRAVSAVKSDDDTTTKNPQASISRFHPPAPQPQHPYGVAPSHGQAQPQALAAAGLGQDTHKAWDASSSPPKKKKASGGIVIVAAIGAMVLGTGAAVWLYKQPTATGGPAPAASTASTAPAAEPSVVATAPPSVEASPSSAPTTEAIAPTASASAAPSVAAPPAVSAAPLPPPSQPPSVPGKVGGPAPVKSGAKPPTTATPAAPATGPGNVKDYGY